MRTMTRTCLDLFCGLGGFSAAFEDAIGWDVVTVDIEERFSPDICADVMDLRPDDLPQADVILASPPCQFLSTAGNHEKWNVEEPVHRDSRHAVALFYHAIGLIRALSPRYWYIENPRRSRIRWFIGPPDEWVTYCQYGTDYQKPTGLWGQHAPMTFERCRKGESCHASNSEDDGTCAIASMDRSDHAKRSKVPYGLSEAIREAVGEAFENPPPEQVTLSESV